MVNTGERLGLGVCLPIWEDHRGATVAWSDLLDLARRAEAAGLDALWVPDHMLLDPHWGARDAWTVLPALAASTTRIQIGTLVTCTGFRQPGLLALMARTLDELSGGRLVLGLGAGYPDRDLSWSAFGYATDHPVGRFEEAMAIITRLLRGEQVTYQGRHYQTDGAELRVPAPRPTAARPDARPNGPPIWIGGGGPRMRRAAVRWADAYNLRVHPSEAEALRAVLGELDQLCRDAARDPATLGRTAFGIVSLADPASLADRFPDPRRARPFCGAPDEIAVQLLALRTAGVSHMACIVDDGETPGPLAHYPVMRASGFERFLLVAAALREMEAAG